MRRARAGANLYAVFTAALRYSARMKTAIWPAEQAPRRWPGYAWALAATAACTVAGMAMSPLFELVNIAMVYLLAVVVVALRFSRGPAVATSFLSVAAFDFFFVPPRLTFAVNDAQYLLTFAIMLVVALVISTLTSIVRRAETEHVRNALLASISHDLRTPLAVISGASSSLAEKGAFLSESAREDLARSIFEHSQHMAELIANVLQMTRLEYGAIAIARDWASLGELAGSVLGRLRERLASHAVSLDLPADLPLVRADAVLIEQVLGNLLENAAKYTPAGTSIVLRAQQREAELLVSVEDAGPGLPAGDAEQLFAKFHRGDSEGAVGGVGLGLAICRAIVRLHGGKIWVERLPGSGAAFRFTLPLEEAPPVPVEAAAPHA
jgi:two-component system, OmpR family, sensor histidine kinase KdpD